MCVPSKSYERDRFVYINHKRATSVRRLASCVSHIFTSLCLHLRKCASVRALFRNVRGNVTRIEANMRVWVCSRADGDVTSRFVTRVAVWVRVCIRVLACSCAGGRVNVKSMLHFCDLHRQTC